MENKLEHLKEYLKGLGSVAVAFSSGVDSTFLLKVAHDVLGDKAIAITAQSCSFPKRELNEAKAFCEKEGIQHVICQLRNWRLKDFQRILRTDVIYVKKNCLRRLAILQKRMGLNILQRDQIWMIMAITDQV